MSTPSTLNRGPKFITDQPDWSKGVELEPQWMTDINRAHNSTEQRVRRRRVPRYRIKYTISALSTAEFSVRRSLSMREVQSPVVLPMWPLRFNPVNVSSPVLTFAEDLTNGPFRVGWMIYLQESGIGNGFWPIVAMDSGTVTLDVTTPLLGFTLAADVWPCIKGYRKDNTATFDFTDLAATDETIEVTDL